MKILKKIDYWFFIDEGTVSDRIWFYATMSFGIIVPLLIFNVI